MDKEINKIISTAIDIDNKPESSSKELISIANDLDISQSQLNSAIAEVYFQKKIISIDSSITAVKEYLIEFSNFKKSGFYIVKNKPQEIESENLYLNLFSNGISPIYSKPFYELCIKKSNNKSTEISWKLNIKKYKESIFALNSLLLVLYLVLAFFGIYQGLLASPIHIGLIYWSRYKAKDKYEKQMLEQMSTLKIHCELQNNDIKLIQ
ncbi:MAG: hypothetical protein COB02_04145 [Candidatus Cloacimonadota bacterium]|nr:MAG: hypothetical protein COB02_04145 [Candidatus Cloacimonadota bacterium]